MLLAEPEYLRSLKSRQDIVIKPADKGGAVTVWRRDLYIAEGERQLHDQVSYRSESESTLARDTKLISKIINKEIREGKLPPKAKLMINNQPKQSRFYLLPKIHKANTPGRPIVSACGCPTEQISQYLDFVLQPLVQSLPTYIKDTKETLQLLKNLNDSPTFVPRFLFTVDVVSLYTSIPHADGLKALSFFLDRRPQSATPPTSTLVRLAELVLTRNSFEFNGELFTQISGVAMGTKMGPSFACLFMGYLEHRIVETYTGPFPELYKQ